MTAARDPAARGLAQQLEAFVTERYPFARRAVLDTLLEIGPAADGTAALEAVRAPFAERLRARLAQPGGSTRVSGAPHAETAAGPDTSADNLETTPGVTVRERWVQAVDDLVEACDGLLRRAALQASLGRDERLEILRGMVLTRATDNRLKTLFTGSEIQYQGVPFQGKGFRSLGQEAIYAAAIRLRRGAVWRRDGHWHGDVVAPVIRDLGVTLAMRPEPATVRMVLSAQMGKSGPPMDGRDLHTGDFDWGVLPAAAPLGIGSLTIAGMALAFALDGEDRVAVSFIGEGGASLGEWHEAINLCAARRLPAIFCLENNQTALSTPVSEQSAARVFADRAAGYGIPGLTIDGTDPDAIAAAFAWAAERARAGHGPALLELVSMRMCGHAHHDDMLYLGRDAAPGWTYPEPAGTGYADRDGFAFWARRDPIARYAARLEADGVLDGETAEEALARLQAEAEGLVEREACAVVEAPWPDPATAGAGVLAGEPPRTRLEPLAADGAAGISDVPTAPPLEPFVFDRQGRTFLEGVMLGIADALAGDPRTFVFGEDVGGRYGNAFLLLRPLLERYGDRILNSTLAEGGVLGVCVGAALAGRRPIGELQFNDFVATGFNQLVNNAAKIRYRWGRDVPCVVRMPWGGLRHAGPYHSQNTEAWFYRTPGLKIAVPSAPADARALLASAVADPDPVLYYEHIALYRDPRIRQRLDEAAPEPLPVGRAALRRDGDTIAIVTYGAYVHVALEVAGRLAADGIGAAVLDLRWLAPLDRTAVLAVARRTGRVLIVHEDTRTGGIGESLAAIIQEEAFEWLDAPVRVIGALDTPVPYAPPLEAAFLPAAAVIDRAARLLAAS
jgi:2-oxoisovalerate dehydrogenase E1 component